MSAHDVASVLRARLPGLPVVELHKLLYYCQGHHLAVFSRPLFSDTVSAWDMGPVVGSLWYAAWRRADAGRRAGTSVPIPPSWMEESFRAAGADDDVVFDAASVSEWLSGAEHTRDAPARRDDPAEIVARIQDLQRETGRRGRE